MSCDWLQKQKNKNAKCRYCGTNKVLTKDHIIPVSRGGKNTKKNYQVLCAFCNHNKGNKTELEIAAIFRSIKHFGVWYSWEQRYSDWLSYIEIKRKEYGVQPLNW